MKIVEYISSVVLLCLPMAFANAQDNPEKRDTLRSASVVSSRTVVRDAGTRLVELPELRTMIAATGEADVIKFIQGLPGVSTGAEGSSAIYVRGGNIGSNVITLDGAPIYGGSHLLGLTSAVPSEMISEASFRVGGFHGDESNITSSHIGLKSAIGSFTERTYSASVSTFMVGASASFPIIRNKMSLVAAVRVSPVGPAFRAIQSIVGGSLDSLSNPRAVAFDAFAKAKWLIDTDNSLSLSVFGSKDGYSYCYGGRSDERIGWGNFIVNARHEGKLSKDWLVEDGVSFNSFSSHQGIVRDMKGTVNNLAIVSSLNELTVEATFSRLLGYSSLRLGARERFAWFSPATSATYKGDGPLQRVDSPMAYRTSHSSISTFHGQWDLSRERVELMASAKLNVYTAHDAMVKEWNWRFNPEASLLARLNIAKWLAVEATADWTVQYYHTLEGIPLGWSVDLLVPTSPNRPPERSSQYYVGIFTSFGNHRITIGAYDKHMDGLVYFSDASLLFSSAIAGWSSNVKVGTGTSRGIEFLYEKVGRRLNWRLAYTLSKTDRTFPEINDGVTFPAKYDRRHILSSTASLVLVDGAMCKMSLTGSYTFQSGHRETVAAGEYPTVTLYDEGHSIDFFSSINNYKMPDYSRLDIGCNFRFKTKCPQELNVGVYNVLNRHNPFSIIYDDHSREWRQVSLIPVMPSFSYHIQF